MKFKLLLEVQIKKRTNVNTNIIVHLLRMHFNLKKAWGVYGRVHCGCFLGCMHYQLAHQAILTYFDLCRYIRPGFGIGNLGS